MSSSWFLMIWVWKVTRVHPCKKLSRTLSWPDLSSSMAQRKMHRRLWAATSPRRCPSIWNWRTTISWSAIRASSMSNGRQFTASMARTSIACCSLDSISPYRSSARVTSSKVEPRKASVAPRKEINCACAALSSSARMRNCNTSIWRWRTPATLSQTWRECRNQAADSDDTVKMTGWSHDNSTIGDSWKNILRLSWIFTVKISHLWFNISR